MTSNELLLLIGVITGIVGILKIILMIRDFFRDRAEQKVLADKPVDDLEDRLEEHSSQYKSEIIKLNDNLDNYSSDMEKTFTTAITKVSTDLSTSIAKVSEELGKRISRQDTMIAEDKHKAEIDKLKTEQERTIRELKVDSQMKTLRADAKGIRAENGLIIDNLSKTLSKGTKAIHRRSATESDDGE